MAILRELQNSLKQSELLLCKAQRTLTALGINEYSDYRKMSPAAQQADWNVRQTEKTIYSIRRQIQTQRELDAVPDMWKEAMAE